MRRLRSLLPLLPLLPLLALACLPASRVAAQEPAEEAEAPAVEAVAASDVPRRAEQAAERLAAWEALAAERVAGGLESVAQGLVRRAGRPLAAPGRQQTLETLADVEDEWNRERDRLADWETILERRAGALESALEALGTMETRWKATQAGAGLPDQVAGRVREILASIGTTRATLRDGRTRLVARRDRLVQADAAVRSVLERVRRARTDIRARLFTLDSPPLWKMLSPDRSLRDQFRGAQEASRRELEAWAGRSRTTAALHAALAVAIFLLVLRLGSSVRAWVSDDESLRHTERVLRRPVAATLLGALLLVPLLYPDAPRLVFDLAQVALLAPILWLLFGLLPGRRVLYLLALLFLVDRLRYFAVDASMLQRLLLFAESALGLLGVRFLRTLTRDTGGRLGIWMRRGTRLGYVLFGAALLANVFGAAQLAALLAGATVFSIYFGVLFYAGARVLNGVVVALLRTAPARRLRMVDQHGPLLRRRATVAVQIALGLLWLNLVLELFAVHDPVLAAGRSALAAELSLGTLSISLGDVLAFFLVVYATVLLSRLIRFVLDEDVLPRLPLPRGVPTAISTVFHYVVLLVGFFFATAAAGMDLSKMAFLVGAFGVGIGFGLQNIVNNFVSGLILLFERPIKVGDWLEIGELYGEVTRIGIRSSTLRTLDAAEVIIPNGSLLESHVVNWTLSDRHRRVAVAIGVAYGSDVGRVLEVLTRTARESPVSLDRPPADVLFTGFGDSSLDFQVRFWVPTFRDMAPALSTMHVAVHGALAEAGITIPFPQRDLHVRTVPPGLGGKPAD